MTDIKWTTNDIPDQKGRVAIITGSNSGIGFETALALAEKNAEVILAVRNQAKGDAAMDKIRTLFPNAHVVVKRLDVANLASVKDFADSFKSEFSRLDLLINNAGIMVPPYGKTVDGFELQFGTNHLGHFALTSHLFDVLKSTLKSRIVNVSSNAYKMGNLNVEDLSWEKRRYFNWKAYGDSKIANLYFTFELMRKIQDKNLDMIATSAHPGLTDTELAKSAVSRLFNKLMAQKGAMGALPTLRAATGSATKNGQYFGPSGLGEWKGYPVLVSPSNRAQDTEIARKLWAISESMTGLKFEI